MEELLMGDYRLENRKVYVVQGKPVPLHRPRMSDHRVYDSQKAIKSRISFELKQQHSFDSPLCGMLHMHIDFYMPLPKTKSHRKYLMQQKYHVYRPDISNLIKLIEDVCVDTRIIEDDCLIASISARKIYSDDPRTEFYFETLKKETDYE